MIQCCFSVSNDGKYWEKCVFNKRKSDFWHFLQYLLTLFQYIKPYHTIYNIYYIIKSLWCFINQKRLHHVTWLLLTVLSQDCRLTRKCKAFQFWSFNTNLCEMGSKLFQSFQCAQFRLEATLFLTSRYTKYVLHNKIIQYYSDIYHVSDNLNVNLCCEWGSDEPGMYRS